MGLVGRCVLVALVWALVVAVAGVPLAQAAPAPIAWAPCGPAGARLECASVPVPLDRRHPAGRRITLAVIRHPGQPP